MKKNILIIEDDEFFRELITKKLLSGGFTIWGVDDGVEGIKKAKESKPDLILLDILLPGADGFEVLSSLKEDPATSSVPIVVLSNLSQKEDIEKALKLGASDFLVKSQFLLNEIIDKIQSFL